MVSGLRINISKSSLIGIDVEEDTLKELAVEIGCGIGRLPFIYLELHVGGNPRLKRLWAPMVEKIERRLAGWGRRYLPLGGRLTLIKSLSTSLPTYYLFEIHLGKGA